MTTYDRNRNAITTGSRVMVSGTGHTGKILSIDTEGLTAEQIRAITELQRADTVFINMGWDFERRKAELTTMFERNHKTPLIEEQHRLAA